MRRFGELQVAEGDRALQVYSGGAGERDYVLIHGIGVSSAYYRPLAEELSACARVHVVELPGFGKTSPPGRPLSMGEFADAVWAALDELRIGEPILVGHSMGAQVVVEMAIQRPGAQPVVLLGPTVDFRRHTIRQQGARLAYDTAIEPLRVAGVVLRDYVRCGPSWYLKTLREMMRHRIEERLPLVAVPVLLLSGRRDPISPPSWLEILARFAHTARIVTVPGEAHVVMYRGARTVAGHLLEEAERGAAEA